MRSTDRHPLLFLDGEFRPEEGASLPLLDRGFHYGGGLCETARAYHGKIFKIQDHLERLSLKAEFVSLEIPYSIEELRSILDQLLSRNELAEAWIRISLRDADGSAEGRRDTRVLIRASPFTEPPESYYKEGIALSLSQIVQGSFLPEFSPASSRFAIPFLSRLDAWISGIREGVLLDEEGIFAGGLTSNIFGIRKGMLLTPSLEPGVLPEVTRQTVLEIAGAFGLKIRETPLSRRDLLKMQEVFLANPLLEILPVVRIEERMIGKGAPGPWTLKLLEAYRRLTREG